MRLNLIDLVVIGALLALLLFAARQEFAHYTPDAAAPGEAAP